MHWRWPLHIRSTTWDPTLSQDAALAVSPQRRPAPLHHTAAHPHPPHPDPQDLLRCNTALLEALQPLERADGSSDVVGVIARAFLAVAPFFKLYTTYCQNYELGLKTLSGCRQSSPQLNAFLATQMQTPSCHGLTLESFLIKPIQRLMKYPLFFKDLLKEVPPSHPSCASLAKAAHLVSEVSQSVDARLSDPSAKMAERLQPLGAEWLNLLAPHRELCLEFYCNIQCGSGHRFPAVGYLFTDLLLLCKRKDKGELKPWLLESLPQCLVGDHALLDHGAHPQSGAAESSGLWSEEVEVQEAGAGGGGFFRKKGPAEKRQEMVLAVRVVKEDGFRLSTSSAAEMEQLLSCLNDTLDKLREHSVEKKRRMIKRESKISLTDSEAVTGELTLRLRERGVQKKTRATLLEGASAARLEGGGSSMIQGVHNSMISKSMMAGSKNIEKARRLLTPSAPRRHPCRHPCRHPLGTFLLATPHSRAHPRGLRLHERPQLRRLLTAPPRRRPAAPPPCRPCLFAAST